MRREIEPVTAAQFQRFLFRWQHLQPGSQLHGADGTLQIVKQLQGYEISAAAWEADVLSRRVAHYEPDFLDQLCLSGEVMWARLSPHPAFEDAEPRRVRPTRTAPISFFLRENADWLTPLRIRRRASAPSLSHAAREVLTQIEAARRIVLRRPGARHRPPGERSGGRAVGTGGRRAGDRRWFRESALAGGSQAPARRRAGKFARPRHAAGRWALVRHAAEARGGRSSRAGLRRSIAARWGVLFRDLLARETWRRPGAICCRCCAARKRKAKSAAAASSPDFSGEQFARPEALDLLRAIRRAAIRKRTSRPRSRMPIR